ncbi:hypothetical protein SteCoe_8768 [Stentor coeruleus]|uniref:J domain-containing protein n=1 Tax=Stentor coeruleus TaxID=5963 RepID=A0A1R2CJL1_9CILI|nr:hypothetical protein SteCoe_8768 [Stentor coeruleus]
MALAQDLICQEILSKDNYYKILNLQPNCTFEQIKKSYKVIALKVHPDKNKSPQAQEAFQKLSKAFVCLNSEDLRNIYDQAGSEPVPDSTFHQKFDENFAEKVFADVFKDSQTVLTSSQQPIYKSYLTKFMLLQFIPVFIILFICMYQSSIENSKDFAFSMSPYFNVRKITQEGKVVYYVNSDFNRELNDEKLEKLEVVVEKMHEKYLEYKSQREKNRKTIKPVDQEQVEEVRDEGVEKSNEL